MKKEEVIKWLMIMKANLNSFPPEVSGVRKIEALAEAIRLLKNERSIDKIDCEHTECRNCTNHKYCDYEISSSENPNKSENPTSSDCVDRHSVDMLAYRYLSEPTDNHVAFYEDFLDLPSVTPIRPKGHWREVDTNMYACSKCSHVLTIDPLDNSILGMNTCPFCSAYMEWVEYEKRSNK